MSNQTQEEIAAPKACKTISVLKTHLFVILSATACATAIVFFAFISHAFVADMFANSTALTITVLALLLAVILATAIVMIIKKAAQTAAVFAFFIALTTVLVLCLAVLQQSGDVVLYKLFKLSILFVILFCGMIVGSGAILIVKNRGSKDTVLAATCGIILSLSGVFSFFLRSTVNHKQWIVAGFSVAVAAFVCLIFSFFGKEEKESKITTKWLTYCATFAALGIIFKMIGNSFMFTDALKITLVYVPWVISGLVLGPVGGMTCALVSDTLGQLMLPGGASGLNGVIMLANTLFPLFPALAYKYLFKKERRWLGILIGMTVSLLVCSLGISSWAQWFFYNKGTKYWAFMSTKAFLPLVVAVNYVIIVTILPALKRAKITELRFLPQKPQHQ